MADISREQVFELARLAGIELDDKRAGTIAARLSGVLGELDLIPDAATSEVEPLVVFHAQVFPSQEEERHG